MTDRETETELKALLASYAAPTPDDGFTQSVMARLPREATSLPADLTPEPSRWRYGMLALALGGAAGLAWRFGGPALLDLFTRTDMTPISPYIIAASLCAVTLCAWALIEAEAV